MARKPVCHPRARHWADGLCEACWRRRYQRQRYQALAPEARAARLLQMRERARAKRLEAAARKGGPR